MIISPALTNAPPTKIALPTSLAYQTRDNRCFCTTNFRDGRLAANFGHSMG